MRKMMKTFFNYLFIVFLLFSDFAWSQISAGKIVYERRTNLYKKFKHWSGVEDWISKTDKNKVDEFELLFNDSLSFFHERQSNEADNFSWATSKNTVYQNFRQGTRFSIKPIWGENTYLQDSLYQRKWKITDSKRTICGYNCRKAVWQPNDSTRFYAWYCDEISASVGPESFIGLPGAILGFATEDGGVVYFAKHIEAVSPDIALLVPKKTKAKIYTSPELKAKLEKDYGKEKWGKAMIANVFGYW